MIGETQKIEILQKLVQILKVLPETSNINDISNMTNIPTSTIQRYLNRDDYFKELIEYRLMSEEDVIITKEIVIKWLRQAKTNGLKKGGKKSQAMFGYAKADDGTFIGHGK